MDYTWLRDAIRTRKKLISAAILLVSGAILG